MKSLVTSILLGTCGSILLALTGCSQPFRASIDRTETHPLTGVSELEVVSANGSIVVRVDPNRTDLAVVSTITGAGMTEAEALDRANATRVEFQISDSGTVAKLFLIFPDERRGNEGGSFVIDAPPLVRLDIETGNGAVDVTGPDGKLDIETSNGVVTVRDHRGTLGVDTSNGAVVLESVSGSIAARTSNGNVTFSQGSAGDSTASDEFQIETSNGAVELTVATGFHGSIDAKTSNGSIACERSDAEVAGARNEKVLRFGDGSRCRIHTSNGSIVVR